MYKEKIPEIARHNLADLLNKPGTILYSSHETLKHGDIYLLGFNPGGANGTPLSESIDGMLTKTINAYLDGIWDRNGRPYPKGKAPLQLRVCWLLTSLNVNPSDVCVSNSIFFQSRKATGINFSHAKRCWPVHEVIIKLVQPKLIIAFGNGDTSSTYSYIRNHYNRNVKVDEDTLPSGHGNWKLKGFNTTINGQSVYVAGLPHLSRYCPIDKDHIVKWLSAKIGNNRFLK